MITIGIGCGADAWKVVQSANEAATEDLHIRCFCCTGAVDALSSGPFVELAVYSLPYQHIVDDLLAGKINGAVRGTLPANETLRYLKKACGVDRLERIALLETVDHQYFFLAPVGVDEGWTIQEKISLINDGRELDRRFGLSEKTAGIYGARIGDHGRHPIVGEIISEDLEIVLL